MNEKKSVGYLSCVALMTCALAGIVTRSSTHVATSNSVSHPIHEGVLSEQDKQTQRHAGYGKMPLYFERNQGQADKEVTFLARGKGYSLGLTPTEAVLTLSSAPHSPRASATDRGAKDDAAEEVSLRMRLARANRTPHVTGVEELSGKVNYIRGMDQTQWRTQIPTYAKVKYEDVYPGVDLLYYGNEGQLEYDFIVAPGADPKAITLGFEGAQKLTVDSQGDLVLDTAGGQFRQHKPFLYQEKDGIREPVSGSYVVRGTEQVGFAVGAYDPARPLIIDPILVYSTYFGGSSDDIGIDVAVDNLGNAYVAGSRPSVTGQDYNAFVAKFSPSGTMLWVSEVGDGCDDQARGIAVDAGGNAYVTGQLGYCYPFPELRPGAFVAKLNSTTGGGVYIFPFSHEYSGSDMGQAVAVDVGGNAYVTGLTSSSYFPTTPGALQPNYGGGLGDGFVVKVNAPGSRSCMPPTSAALGMSRPMTSAWTMWATPT